MFPYAPLPLKLIAEIMAVILNVCNSYSVGAIKILNRVFNALNFDDLIFYTYRLHCSISDASNIIPSDGNCPVRLNDAR